MEGEAPSPPETVAPAAAPRAGGRPPLHWLLEGLLIVVSVVLGFAVSEYGKARDDRELARRMLAGIQAEIEYNRKTLEPFIPIHRAWSEALARRNPADGSGAAVELFFETRPALPAEIKANVPLLRRAAWDTAVSSGGLRLIDYDLAAALSEMYRMQDYAYSTFGAMFSQPAFFDPAGRAGTFKQAQTMMVEMTWAEETVLGLYDKHLPAIRAAAQ
jgi:hypothetical protein